MHTGVIEGEKDKNRTIQGKFSKLSLMKIQKYGTLPLQNPNYRTFPKKKVLKPPGAHPWISNPCTSLAETFLKSTTFLFGRFSSFQGQNWKEDFRDSKRLKILPEKILSVSLLFYSCWKAEASWHNSHWNKLQPFGALQLWCIAGYQQLILWNFYNFISILKIKFYLHFCNFRYC